MEACEGLSSLRPPEINGGFRCSASVHIRSKYLYARLIDGGWLEEIRRRGEQTAGEQSASFQEKPRNYTGVRESGLGKSLV